jgi:20S proteasome alpha/beta subunit
MTIALGFRCQNGVVIASDSHYTQDISKTRGQKIFIIPTNGYYALTIGGAGGSNQIKWTVTEIQHSLADEVGARSSTILEIRQIIESVLRKSFVDHVDAAPLEEQRWLEFGLLIGIWTPKERSILFKSQRDIVVQVDTPNHVTIGAGSYLTEYVLGALFDRTWMLSVDEATSVAAYIVTMAKEHVDGCGGSTFVRVLDDDGHDVRIGNDEVENAVDYFTELFRWTSSLCGFLSSGLDLATLDMVPYANILRDNVIKFRKYQDERRAFSNDLITRHGKRPIE